MKVHQDCLRHDQEKVTDKEMQVAVAKGVLTQLIQGFHVEEDGPGIFGLQHGTANHHTLLLVLMTKSVINCQRNCEAKKMHVLL